ncbi:MAG: DUF4159 domain-containing protein [Verrucomicrobiota bacterium]
MTAHPPPTQEPPPQKLPPLEPLADKRKPRGNEETWQDKLLRSRYFVIALALHAVGFLMLGTVVVFETMLMEEEEAVSFVQGDGLDVGSPPPPMEAPPEDPNADVNPEDIQVPTQQVAALPTDTMMDVIGTQNALATAPPIPVPPAPTPNVTQNMTTSTTSTVSQGASLTSASFNARAGAIRDTVYNKWGRGRPGQIGTNVTAEFKAYLGKYRDGDWASTVSLKNGKIVNGSIFNLMYYTTDWTKNRVKATLVPEPLDLGSPELLEVMPPFVLMTGRKDFTLTQTEVTNLQKYLVNGGCIWGDSGLAGQGSRFDVAFKREMKRVLPDADKLWEPIPNDHPIYTAGQFKLSGPPPGMNFYAEPIEVIKMDNQIAVIYTPNDYADMFRMVYTKERPYKVQRNSRKVTRFTPDQLWQNKNSFFRNFEIESTEKTYQLGINVIVHLLLRFDRQLQMATGS